MAYLLDCYIENYEVRGVQTGTSKKGNTFKSIKLESPDGNNVEISCTDEKLFYDVDNLRKGDYVSCQVMAVSGRERSYISLRSMPIVKGNAYTGEV